MRRHWEGNTRYALVPVMLRDARKVESFLEPPGSAKDAEFDLQKDLVTLRIACIPEQMRFTEEKVSIKAGQPVKLIFTNPDATDHNWVLVQPGSMEEVGMAANEMVKNPKNARSDFIPKDPDRHILQYTPLIGPSRNSKVNVLRFIAPKEPGIYPYLCTFPGHWVVMNGALWVTNDEVSEEDLQQNLSIPVFVKDWQMADFEAIQVSKDEHAIMRGMQSFLDAQCHQCHQMDGRGIELGPDLSNVSERFRGRDLLQQILKPSSHIDEPYRLVRVETKEGEEWSGNLVDENEQRIRLRPSLFAPDELLSLRKKQIKTRETSAVSPMPEGMLSTMDRQAILDLLAYLEAGGHAGHQKH